MTANISGTVGDI